MKESEIGPAAATLIPCWFSAVLYMYVPLAAHVLSLAAVLSIKGCVHKWMEIQSIDLHFY
jgi:hypothetical protein